MSNDFCTKYPLVTTASAWCRGDLLKNELWITEPDERLLFDIERFLYLSKIHRVSFLKTIKAAGFEPIERRRHQQFLSRMRRSLLKFGLVLIKGLPIEDWTVNESRIVLWALGSLLGTPITQKPYEFIVDVLAINHQPNKEKIGGQPNTSEYLSFHCDASDILALLCVTPADRGGESKIVSSHSIYNQILTEHCESLPSLFQGFHYGKRGEERNGLPVVSKRIPVFSWHRNNLSCRFIKTFITEGAKMACIKFTEHEDKALNVFESSANDENLSIDIRLKQGDVLFLNNYMVLHGRTGFHDNPSSSSRHLMKLWIKSEGRGG